jgi:hypothetical protein
MNLASLIQDTSFSLHLFDALLLSSGTRPTHHIWRVFFQLKLFPEANASIQPTVQPRRRTASSSTQLNVGLQLETVLA